MKLFVLVVLASLVTLSSAADSTKSTLSSRRQISQKKGKKGGISKKYRDGPVSNRDGACATTIATTAQEVGENTGLGADGVTTEASIVLQFDQGLSKARFDLVVENGVGISQGHLHCGRAGMNGPVIAFVFAGPDGLLNVDVNGVLNKGTLTNEDLLTPCPPNVGIVANIASLKAAIDDGLVYLNVHSVEFPAGVVRGQVQIE